MAGGGTPGVVPTWLFGEGTGGALAVLRSWTVEDGVDIDDLVGHYTTGWVEGGDFKEPGAGAYDIRRALAQDILVGATPYGTLAADISDPEGLFAVEDTGDLVGSLLKAYLRRKDQFDTFSDGLLTTPGADQAGLIDGVLNNTSYDAAGLRGPGDAAARVARDTGILMSRGSSYNANAALDTQVHRQFRPYAETEYSITNLVGAILTSASAGATTELNAALNFAPNSWDSNALGSAQSSIDAADIIADAHSLAEVGLAATRGTTNVGLAVVAATTASDASSGVSGAGGDARTSLATSFNAAIDIITNASDGLQIALTAALSAASAAAGSTLVNDAVTAFEDQGLPEQARRLSRLAGTMIDINAVHGMSFILGESLLEREHQRNIASFRAQLSTELYTRAFQAYMDTFNRALDLYLQHITATMNQQIELQKSFLSERARAFLSSFSEHIGLYSRLIASFEDKEASSLSALSSQANQIISAHESFTSQWGSTHVQKAVDSHLTRLGHRDDFGKKTYSSMQNLLVYGLGARSDEISKLEDLQKVRVGMDFDYAAQMSEIDRKDRLWRLEGISKAVGILGTPAGVAQYQSGFERFMSAMGGGQGASEGVAGAAKIAAMFV